MLETLQRETRADIVRLGEKPVRGQPRGERCRPAGGQGQGPADPEGLPFPSSQKRRKGQPPRSLATRLRLKWAVFPRGQFGADVPNKASAIGNATQTRRMSARASCPFHGTPLQCPLPDPARGFRTGRVCRPQQNGIYGDGVHSRSEEHTSELQSPCNLVCRLLLEKKKK